MNDISMDYNADKRRALITFPNGRTLTVSDISEEKAREFLTKHAGEFQKRDCCLTSVDGQFTRETANG
ncbi:MAG: hypothetical protein AB7X49_26555 [Geminicoccaceae bacterium]